MLATWMGFGVSHKSLSRRTKAERRETLISSLAAIRRGGTLISLAGPPPQEQARERGVRAIMIHSQPSSALLQTLTQLIDEGRLKVPVETTFPLRKVQQAHEHSQSGHGRGRIVLRIADEATISCER
jgi:NADPH:quinone reductase-like Zn-dependent oxidoreductase